MVGSAVALVGSGMVWEAGPVQAAFPGGNGVIACSSNRDGNFEIYTFNPNGTELGVTRLTNNPASDGRPRYSPDGRQIAFESNRDGPQEIYIMNADGTNIRRLTFSGVPGVHGNSSPAWSPGADQIAYQSTRDGNFEVYRIDIDGQNDTRLTNLPVEESLPAWSPLGDKIAYNSRAVDPSANVHLMNPDGTDKVSLPAPGNLPGTEDSWPTWSPDGSMIGFHSRRDDPSGEEIYRMNRDGSNVVRLTFNTGPSPTNFDIFPAWSPDGTRIVWNSGRSAANFGEVYTMNASDGGNIVRITQNDAVDQRCDWQPICTIYGAGDINGTPGNDIICGSDGPDRILGGGGNDIILGLGGDDQLLGNAAGNDRIFGGAGNDRITGQGGVDIIDGGIGNDQCIAPTRNCP
jgi:Tol biopolymer transport system component